jgi:hypothetical protein
MPRQLHWTELIGGIVAAGVIAGLVLVILFFARVGALHGKKVTLYVVTDDASGVLPGTEVWLGGKKEGLVRSVTFRPPGVDTLERVLITTDFLAEGLPNTRRDSYAQIEPGGSMIGTMIVYISTGTALAPPLHNGDTLHARETASIANLAEDVSTLTPEFAALGSQMRQLNAKAASQNGTIGSLRAHGLPGVADVSTRISRVSKRLSRANGTLDLATHGNLKARASEVMAGVDSIRMLLSSNKGSIGRFRRDTTLVTKARGVMSKLDSLSAMLANPIGSIEAAHPDSALSKELTRSRALLDSLMTDVKKHPLRYISL